MSATANINLDEIQSKVNSMSLEDLQKLVFETKVRQKVATKKYYNPDNAKKQRQAAAARVKAASELLRAQPATIEGYANLLDQLEAEAREAADAKLAEAEEESTTVAE